MPNTCDITTWKSKNTCSFSMRLPDVLGLPGGNVINFAIKKCPDSDIWPQMSIHTEKFTFIDNFMKPCSEDSDCGIGVQCQGPLEAVGTFRIPCEWHCDISTCDCTDKGNHENIKNCKWFCMCPHDYLHVHGYCEVSSKTYFRAGKFISDTLIETRVFDNVSSCSNFNPSNVGKVVQNKIMSFISKIGWGVDYSPIDNIKFCGLNNVSDETMSDFHRQTMDHLTQLTNTISNRRSLLDDHESGGEDILNSIFELLDVKSWHDPAALKLDSLHQFKKPIPKDGILNLFRVTCGSPNSPPMFSIMEENALGGLNAYFGRYSKLSTFAEKIVKELVDCRKSKIDHFRTRFLMFDPSFWMNLFIIPNDLIVNKNNGYDTSSWLYSMFNESIAPKFKLPKTCTLKHFLKYRRCTMIYDEISSFLKALGYKMLDIKMVFDMRTCENNPNAFSVSVDCKGSDCSSLFNSPSMTCSTDAHCDTNSFCQPVDMCDPIGDIMWGGNMTVRNMDTSVSCPQDDDQCTEKKQFQSQVVNQYLKMVGKDTRTSHSGLCMPKLLQTSLTNDSDVGKNLETWFKDNFDANETSGIVTIKGLLPYLSDGLVQNTVVKFSMAFATTLSNSEILILENAIKQAFVIKIEY
eukprot:TRINITY_DN47_c0_g1_i5.p1 TRINITY_DN47_c0_g1~~TRINITY_DN47_c0_g1_i5.p1  ORF type:complete len:632 (-),score=110.02 TRINITY_DN47_c0_g1_i5:512-2407(-)